MSFANAVDNSNQQTVTTNGMSAYSNTGSKCLDLFGQISTSDLNLFKEACIENVEYATRIALWARDIRSGAGRRQFFKDMIKHLFNEKQFDILHRVIKKIPELGRWDDLLPIALMDPATNKETKLRDAAVDMIKDALEEKDSLCAKWMPLNNKNKKDAAKLRDLLGYSPIVYRKLLVSLRKSGNVVEQKMCAKDWDNIDFNMVPSMAVKRYTKCFTKHTNNFSEWKEKLVTGGENVKINAGAIYPYDVLTNGDADVRLAQWNALPNYVGDYNIFPVCDTSGSMDCVGVGKTTARVIALSLGLYLADKNTGPFNGVLSLFSEDARIINLKGNINNKINQIPRYNASNTNLVSLFDKLLKIALENKVQEKDMPKAIVIFSDMQFDEANDNDSYNVKATEMINKKYESAGYKVPTVVYWNLDLANYGNVPTTVDAMGTILVSGFSPSLFKTIFTNLEEVKTITPKKIMDSTILDPRYNF